jgi:hypothetical protein
LREVIEALDQEIRAARRDPARAFEVRDGRRLFNAEEEHLYAFKADVALPIPPDTPLKVLVAHEEAVSGSLIAQADFELVLQLHKDLGEHIEIARVVADASFITEALSRRLQEELDSQTRELSIPMALLGLEIPETSEDSGAITRARATFENLRMSALVPNAAQLIAVGRCVASRLHFVWGPPGTGKTANVAHVARTLVEAKERVLILAHANAAVDVAMLRVADAFTGTGELDTGQILRIGVPQLTEVQNRGDILPDEIIARKQPELVARKRRLEGQRKELLGLLQNTAPHGARASFVQKLDAVRKELAIIRETLRGALHNLIREARVIGATLSRLIIDDEVWNWAPDAVVVDETSMAAFPAVTAGAFQARKRLLLFGDFRQLPPICVSTSPLARRWLARDAFEVAGVRGRIDAGQPEPRVTLLDTQYRMAAPIAEVVSSFAYAGRVRSAANTNAEPLAMRAGPWPGESLVLVDTSALASACIKEPKAGSYSRANPLHALLALSLAERFARDGCSTFAIVTPYRAQARLLAAGVRNFGDSRMAVGATVHRFQGSERDVIVFDLVDGHPQSGASRITGKDAETALRLLNVGISRARARLIVLADLEFIERRHPRSSPARKLVRILARKGRVQQVEPTFLARETLGGTCTWLGNWREAQGLIAEDLQLCRRAAYLNLPPGFEPAPTIVDRLQHLSTSARVILFASTDVAARLEDSGVDLRLMMRPGGCFALIDQRAAFIGSMSLHGPVARVEGVEIVKALDRVLMGSTAATPPPNAMFEAAIAKVGGRCPDCGRDRLPRRAGGAALVLGCEIPNHQKVAVNGEKLRDLVEAVDVRCGECGERAVVREGKRGAFLACPRSGRGCKGQVPNLEEFFGVG